MLIKPVFVVPSALIACVPFRYVWNNPPSFVSNVWMAFLTPVAVFFAVTLGLAYLMTVCWDLWKSE